MALLAATSRDCLGFRSANESVYDIWMRLDNITIPALPGEPHDLVIPEIDALGSGSDHTAYASHIGITSTQVGIIHPIQPYYAEYHRYAVLPTAHLMAAFARPSHASCPAARTIHSRGWLTGATPSSHSTP